MNCPDCHQVDDGHLFCCPSYEDVGTVRMTATEVIARNAQRRPPSVQMADNISAYIKATIRRLEDAERREFLATSDACRGRISWINRFSS